MVITTALQAYLASFYTNKLQIYIVYYNKKLVGLSNFVKTI